MTLSSQYLYSLNPYSTMHFRDRLQGGEGGLQNGSKGKTGLPLQKNGGGGGGALAML